MKKMTYCKRLFAAMICLVMLLAAVSVTASAAKENFATCGSIGVRNCEAPVCGEHPDFDVTPYSPGQYEIKSVNWYKGTVVAANRLSATSIFERGMVYIVEFEVWAKDAYTFTTDSNGYTTVTANVGTGAGNGEYPADVYNVFGKANTKYLTVRCTFTEPLPKAIHTVTVTDVLEPYAGDKVGVPYYASTITSVPTYYGYGDATYVQHTNWYDGTTQMSSSDTFVEGKTYTLQLVLAHNVGYEFAVDPNHILASAGKPFTAVTATINGKTATVLPDYTRGDAYSHIVISVQFVCKPSRQITHVDIKDVTEPKTGEEPKYYISCADKSYDRHELSNVFYAYGVAWLDGKDNLVRRNEHTFLPSASYTISVTLKPTGDYIFAADEYGRPLVTATVNGKEAEVHKSDIEDGCIEVTYKFRKTQSLDVTKVEVQGIDAPKDGALPDYTMTLGDSTYAPFYAQDDEVTKNSISWLDRTTNKYMKVGVDKFVGGHNYTLFVVLKTTGDYTFKPGADPDTYDVTAKINGKTAQVDECSEDEIIIYYDFSCEKPVHVCSPVQVEEVKATCTETGKKAYYSCKECGKFFEDSRCTKQITDIKTWGIIAKLAHTGGKATCTEQAECSRCGEPYGELGSHNYSTGWDYKDAGGHAHVCKVCGKHDTVVPHSGAAPKCGEKAKCEACREEYGEVAQHQWSTTPEYTDAKGHANQCSVCGKHDTIVPHSGAAPKCGEIAKCEVCKAEYGEVVQHQWSKTPEYIEAGGHANVCKVCGKHDTVVPHSGAAPKCGEIAKCEVCKAEYGEVVQHQWSKTPEYTDSKGHAYKCTVCGEHDTVQAHTGGTADCRNKAVCSACGTAYGKTGDHKWSGEWLYKTANGHAHGCTVAGCDAHDTVVKHTPGAEATEDTAQLCTVCSYTIKPMLSHKHNLSKTEEVDPTCTANGKKAYFTCDSCDGIFSDSRGSNEIVDLSELTIPATGHKDSRWKFDADVHWKECTVEGCGAVTVEKEAHEFNKSGKCKVCRYSPDGETDPPEVTGTTQEEDTTAPAVSGDGTTTAPETTAGGTEAPTTTAPAATVPATTDADAPSGGADHTGLWIALIVTGILAIAGVAVVAVVLIRKNKKPDEQEQ